MQTPGRKKMQMRQNSGIKATRTEFTSEKSLLASNSNLICSKIISTSCIMRQIYNSTHNAGFTTTSNIISIWKVTTPHAWATNQSSQKLYGQQQKKSPPHSCCCVFPHTQTTRIFKKIFRHTPHIPKAVILSALSASNRPHITEHLKKSKEQVWNWLQNAPNNKNHAASKKTLQYHRPPRRSNPINVGGCSNGKRNWAASLTKDWSCCCITQVEVYSTCATTYQHMR